MIVVRGNALSPVEILTRVVQVGTTRLHIVLWLSTRVITYSLNESNAASHAGNHAICIITMF